MLDLGGRDAGWGAPRDIAVTEEGDQGLPALPYFLSAPIKRSLGSAKTRTSSAPVIVSAARGVPTAGGRAASPVIWRITSPRAVGAVAHRASQSMNAAR